MIDPGNEQLFNGGLHRRKCNGRAKNGIAAAGLVGHRVRGRNQCQDSEFSQSMRVRAKVGRSYCGIVSEGAVR